MHAIFNASPGQEKRWIAHFTHKFDISHGPLYSAIVMTVNGIPRLCSQVTFVVGTLLLISTVDSEIRTSSMTN
jgi:hypothetical protein